MTEKVNGLTNKCRLFIAEYLKDFNATQAAIRAGYSPKTAYSIGQELLKKPEVSAAIDERIMSADEAAARITDIARGDLADLMSISTSGFTLELLQDDGQGGKVVNPHTKLIRKIKQKVTTILGKSESDEDREIVETEIELYSAHEAAKDILKYRGKLIDRSDVTSGGKPLRSVEVVPVDYRTAIAALAPGPMEDSATSGENQSPVNGQEMG